MKRTPEQARSFFETRNTASRGEGRELYRTPVPLIELIVGDIVARRPDLAGRKWIDPCAGDGRWGDVIRSHGIECLDYDLHPLREGIAQQDFLQSDFGMEGIFFIGNPPFSMVRQFVAKSLEQADSCYYLGGSRIVTGAHLGEKVSLLHRFEGYEGNQKDRRSKAWFQDTNGKDVIIWTCGAIFDRNIHNPFHISSEIKDNSFSTGVHCFCEEDERVVAIGKNGVLK